MRGLLATDEASKGQVDPDYAAGKVAIAAKDWKAAIRSLSSAALRDTRNADIENYLGYAYRQTGDLKSAFLHYQRALRLDPRHRGAHEYIVRRTSLSTICRRQRSISPHLNGSASSRARSTRTSRRQSPTTGRTRAGRHPAPGETFCETQARRSRLQAARSARGDQLRTRASTRENAP